MAQYLCGCNWMHLLYANASFAGAGVLIMLAPMIRETPAAMEKNAVAEEMSRMRGREVKGTLQHEPDPARLSLLFAIIRWPVPKRKAAR
jgi:hypothetical protein